MSSASSVLEFVVQSDEVKRIVTEYRGGDARLGIRGYRFIPGVCQE